MVEIVDSVSLNLQVSEQRKEQFKKYILTDKELSKLKEYCINGWPECKKNVSKHVQQYYNIRNDIHVADDPIFYKYRVIVPNQLRAEMLNKLHEGHFGITKTKLRAKDVLYWPTINKQIEKLILKCSICERYRNANVKDYLMPHYQNIHFKN